jgi:hypothetical protein
MAGRGGGQSVAGRGFYDNLGPLRGIPALLARLLVGVGLVWGGVALEKETVGLISGWHERQRNAPPAAWRFGSGPVERFCRLMAGAGQLLPADTVVLFVSPPGDQAAEFFRWRWAAYLLPEQNLTTLDFPDGRQLASHEIAFRREGVAPPGTRLELVRQLPLGRVWRVVRERDSR